MNDAQHDQLNSGYSSGLHSETPSAEQLLISDFSNPAAGASNETLLFGISWQQQGKQHRQPLMACLGTGSGDNAPGRCHLNRQGTVQAGR